MLIEMRKPKRKFEEAGRQSVDSLKQSKMAPKCKSVLNQTWTNKLKGNSDGIRKSPHCFTNHIP
jgi:hypothetical protein